MKKQDYIDAVNEIKASEELKRNTLEKITKSKKNYKWVYSLATAMVVFAVAISISIPMSKNKNVVTPIEVVQKNNGLPKVENFQNLYDMLNKTNNSFSYGMMEEGLVLDSMATNSAVTKQENSAPETSGGADYSKTNVQVEGVDEADIVKTDGEYIYYVSQNKIVIVNAKNENDLKIASEIKYENDNFYPNEIYILENKLAVIGTINEYNYNEDYLVTDLMYPTTTNTYTVAKIYNITNKSKVILEREVALEGNYLSSRMIGETIYFIANKYLYRNLCRQYDKGEITENEFKPQYKDSVIGKSKNYIEFADIYYFPESEDKTYLNIAGFSIKNNEPANIQTYLGAGQNVYSSQNNLYISKTKYEYKDVKTNGYYNNFDLNTYIYKFKLDNSKIEYINVGSVPGEIINQFSMDEKDGNLRIATTDRDNWNSNTDTNNLYVLNENLEIIGQIEGLAKGEKIYSVRFMGNRAYMVTFVQVDPLFVIDLSEPTNPIVLGELKIPGYSKYLHPYDENHIIGFGENTTTTQYGTVTSDGMKMALFDVSNPTEPKELYAVDIGEKGTYSEILYNHKSLLFSKEKNIIAFPISISEEYSNYRTNLKFQGAIIYGLDLENGFTLKGQIAHMETEDGYRDYDYTKAVERIIYINNNFYTLSKGLIKSTNMDTMEEIDNLEIKIEDQENYLKFLY